MQQINSFKPIITLLEQKMVRKLVSSLVRGQREN